MAAKFRNIIASKTINTLRNLKLDLDGTDVRKLAGQLNLEKKQSRICLTLKSNVIPHFSPSLLSNLVKSYPETTEGMEGDTDDTVGIAGDSSSVKFYLDNKCFQAEVLKTTAHRPKGYVWSRNSLFEEEETRNVIIEFSSPNIAKPFHIGHFRSTIIGNFVANIHQAVGHCVRKINYLGDWGTQFGFLMAGIEHFNVDIEYFKEDTLKRMLKIYVDSNQLGESDQSFKEKARSKFSQLESGDPELLKIWNYFRKISIKELKSIYSRLGIEFDEYHGESMYSREKSESIIQLLNKQNILQDLNGKRVVQISPDRFVTIVKSDGSSLYITRDIAAAIDRQTRFEFEKMIYVVDNDQSIHFSNLFSILGNLGFSWASSCNHVRFGKILGMSTRKGNIVFLDTLIDEATERMLEMQKTTRTTRVSGAEGEKAASVLGISALIINDFKQKRTRDYKFSWEQALNPSGDTGVKLQYLHARLSSLLTNCEVELDTECSTSKLVEQEALDLVFQIGIWDETLSRAYTDLEPSILVRYLFQLAHLTNRCLKSLNVKGAEEETARARLLLFYCSRRVLADCLNILGVQPLERM